MTLLGSECEQGLVCTPGTESDMPSVKLGACRWPELPAGTGVATSIETPLWLASGEMPGSCDQGVQCSVGPPGSHDVRAHVRSSALGVCPASCPCAVGGGKVTPRWHSAVWQSQRPFRALIWSTPALVSRVVNHGVQRDGVGRWARRGLCTPLGTPLGAPLGAPLVQPRLNSKDHSGEGKAWVLGPTEPQMSTALCKPAPGKGGHTQRGQEDGLAASLSGAPLYSMLLPFSHRPSVSPRTLALLAPPLPWFDVTETGRAAHGIPMLSSHPMAPQGTWGLLSLESMGIVSG